MNDGRFKAAGTDLGDRAWPKGPYRAASMFERRRGKEVGSSVEFCYPREQYVAFNRERNDAQTAMMVLAPEMAEIILAFEAQDVQVEGSAEMAEKLKAIDNRTAIQ